MRGLAADTRGAPPAIARRLFTAEGPVDGIDRSDSSNRIFAAMNLVIESDPPFQGEGMSCEDVKGAAGYCELPPSDMGPIVPPSSAPHDADICIWLIERGHLTIEQNSGAPVRFGAGSLLLCDHAHPLRGRWERSRLGYVRPARQRLMQVLGHGPGRRGRPVETIEHLGLAPFLGAQLSLLARHGAALTSANLAIVLGNIFQTTEALLGTMLMPSPQSSKGPVDGRLQVVRRFMQSNMHRHDLSVTDIARGTNISRAQLYRLFESQDKSVHGTLREERLANSLSYLRQPESGRLSIGAIAYACGFADQAVFSKLFRQRFGMTPREARQRVAEQS